MVAFKLQFPEKCDILKKEEVEIKRITHFDSIRGLDIKIHNGQIFQVELYDFDIKLKKGMILNGFLIGIGEVEKIFNTKQQIIISSDNSNTLLDVIGKAKNLSRRSIEIESIIYFTVEHKNMEKIIIEKMIKEGDLIHFTYPITPAIYLTKSSIIDLNKI
jgi:hypothetical protein